MSGIIMHTRDHKRICHLLRRTRNSPVAPSRRTLPQPQTCYARYVFYGCVVSLRLVVTVVVV